MYYNVFCTQRRDDIKLTGSHCKLKYHGLCAILTSQQRETERKATLDAGDW